MENSSEIPAHRPSLPQPPLSIGHLILLTAGVGIATQINNFEWTNWGWRSALQGAEIGFQGFVISVAGLGLIRLAARIISAGAPYYRTLPGHMLTYLRFVMLAVNLAGEWAVPWIGTLAWSGKTLDARREIALLIVVQLLTLPAIAWFRHRVKGSLGWHLVALAILLHGLVNLVALILSAMYHSNGITWMLTAAGGLTNPISFVVQWSLIAATILFALIHERFTRSTKIDWLHTTCAIVVMAWAALYIFVYSYEAIW
jgi:hypothetical protein